MSTERRRHPRYETAARVASSATASPHPGLGAQFVNLTVDAYDKLFGLGALAARLSAEPPPRPGAEPAGSVGSES